MPKITPMGVVNITPNSFSDGQKYLNKNSLIEQWNDLLSWAQIIDVGAESTAPMNQSISAEQEIERYQENFLAHLDQLTAPAMLSIDTYKVEVFEWLHQQLQKLWPDTHLIFNDVSGCLDQQLIDLLKGPLKFTYIYSHNQAPERQMAGKHMQFPTPDPVLKHVIEFLKQIESLNIERAIWLDPCLGFSKSREQNHQLVANFAQLCHQFQRPMVFGVSRKSFLRNPPNLDPKSIQAQMFLTSMEALLISDLFESDIKNEIILRTHTGQGLAAAQFHQQIQRH